MLDLKYDNDNNNDNNDDNDNDNDYNNTCNKWYLCKNRGAMVSPCYGR